MCLIVWSVLFSFLAFAAEGEKHLPDVISMAEHPRLLLLDKDIPQIKSQSEQPVQALPEQWRDYRLTMANCSHRYMP